MERTETSEEESMDVRQLRVSVEEGRGYSWKEGIQNQGVSSGTLSHHVGQTTGVLKDEAA